MYIVHVGIYIGLKPLSHGFRKGTGIPTANTSPSIESTSPCPSAVAAYSTTSNLQPPPLYSCPPTPRYYIYEHPHISTPAAAKRLKYTQSRSLHPPPPQSHYLKLQMLVSGMEAPSHQPTLRQSRGTDAI
ncbi:hypothetical protein P167DRAFT_356459 [Morchella conica CCBAS932]|uniref:Uncharacterized protein n=1 Tax=Morchella conica CCBAS932 TaxID=1392247 RepID=A0A3N4KD30_9PEZI|nr:hypothetical protein P167DRAFT_356459 [Morchella conica CCBAS932]